MVAIEVSGTAVPEGKGPKTISVSGGKLTGLEPDMLISTDAEKKPKQIDLTFK